LAAQPAGSVAPSTAIATPGRRAADGDRLDRPEPAGPERGHHTAITTTTSVTAGAARSTHQATDSPALPYICSAPRDEMKATLHRDLTTGLSNAELATRLTLSTAIAKTHVARTLSKLGLRDRVQTVVLAYETGLISPGGTE
jgi:hypothetical protein